MDKERTRTMGTRDSMPRPIDEQYETMHDVIQNPFGALTAIHDQAEEIAFLRQVLRLNGRMLMNVQSLGTAQNIGPRLINAATAQIGEKK
jgi:hypothetical protein